MIENVQRTDLTAQDKENAIREMLAKGLSQKEIADLLSKPISYVSDIVAGTKVREVAESAGVKTENLGTRALAQFRSIKAEDLPGKVQELAENGGTNAAATKILHDYKDEQAPAIGTPEFEEDSETVDQMAEEALKDDDFEIEEKADTHVSSKKLSSKEIVNNSYIDKCVTVADLLADLKKMPGDTPICFKNEKTVRTLHFAEFECLNPSFPQRVSNILSVPYRLVFAITDKCD